jgi:predicted metal-binding membrane protein
VTWLSPGPVGALIGLVAGLVEYWLVSGVVVAALRRTNRSRTAAEHEDYERRIRILRAVLLLMTVGVMPILGFVIGRTLFG